MANTEGHRLLKGWLSKTGVTQSALARGVGRSEPAVSLWFRKGSRPDGDARVRLHELAGIPVEAWTQRINGKRKAS